MLMKSINRIFRKIIMNKLNNLSIRMNKLNNILIIEIMKRINKNKIMKNKLKKPIKLRKKK